MSAVIQTLKSGWLAKLVTCALLALQVRVLWTFGHIIATFNDPALLPRIVVALGTGVGAIVVLVIAVGLGLAVLRVSSRKALIACIFAVISTGFTLVFGYGAAAHIAYSIESSPAPASGADTKHGP